MQYNKTPHLPIPAESTEQQRLFKWANYQYGRFPELALLYRIPNRGTKRKAEAGHFSAEGVKSGVPDLCLPVTFHGLCIEMKRRPGGQISAKQKEWLSKLAEQGYKTAVCKGREAVAKETQNIYNRALNAKTPFKKENLLCFL